MDVSRIMPSAMTPSSMLSRSSPTDPTASEQESQLALASSFKVMDLAQNANQDAANQLIASMDKMITGLGQGLDISG